MSQRMNEDGDSVKVNAEEILDLSLLPPNSTEWLLRREVARELGEQIPDANCPPLPVANENPSPAVPLVEFGTKAREGYRSVLVSWAPGATRQEIRRAVTDWLDKHVPAGEKQAAKGFRADSDDIAQLRDLLALRCQRLGLQGAEAANLVIPLLTRLVGDEATKHDNEVRSHLGRAAKNALKRIEDARRRGAIAASAAAHLEDLRRRSEMGEDLPFPD